MIFINKKRLRRLFAPALFLIALAAILSISHISNGFIGLSTSLEIDENVSNSNVEGIPLTVLMYHGLIKDEALQNKFFISPETFKNDLEYLEKNGYTTISTEELIRYVTEPHSSLPEKPVLLTFDDGYYNNYLYAFPLLKEKNMKAVISIIGSMTEKFSAVDENNAAYSHVTWDQINEMRGSGLIEVQNHTMDLHTYDRGRKGMTQKPGESLEDYRNTLENDIGQLQTKFEEMTGEIPTVFAYPFGFTCKNCDKILKEMGFRLTFGCEEGINHVTKNPDCLYQLKRILRPLDGSLAEII